MSKNDRTMKHTASLGGGGGALLWPLSLAVIAVCGTLIWLVSRRPPEEQRVMSSAIVIGVGLLLFLWMALRFAVQWRKLAPPPTEPERRREPVKRQVVEDDGLRVVTVRQGERGEQRVLR